MQSSSHSIEQLSDTVHCITEHDAFGESPQIYVVIGQLNSVIIDTGVGTGDLAALVREKLGEGVWGNLVLVNTHNHYDHVAGNHLFTNKQICAGARDKEYTTEPFNTMGTKVGCDIKPYKLTRWLENMEKIVLSENDANAYLEVVYSPGHTPDSICLWYPKESRLFVGDFLYLEAPVLCVTVKSCPTLFEKSAHDLVEFIKEKESETGKAITLSCGHINKNLDSRWMEKFYKFIHSVNSGEIEGFKKDDPVYTYFLNEDKQLMFKVGSALETSGPFSF